MTPPVHITVLHFVVVQGCHKTRCSNSSLYLIYTCNNSILKPFQQARIFPVITDALLCNTPKAPLLPKTRPNALDNEVGTSELSDRNTVKRLQKRMHLSINPQLPQLRLDKLRGAVPYSRSQAAPANSLPRRIQPSPP